MPTMAGCVLSDDDRIRSYVIRQIMCNFHLEFATLRDRFGIDYDTYFADEEKDLAPYYQDAFLERSDAALTILPLGQVFIRNVAMVFDAYLKRADQSVQYSRTV